MSKNLIDDFALKNTREERYTIVSNAILSMITFCENSDEYIELCMISNRLKEMRGKYQ